MIRQRLRLPKGKERVEAGSAENAEHRVQPGVGTT